MNDAYLSSSYLGNATTIDNARKALLNLGYIVREYIKGQPYNKDLLSLCNPVVIAVPIKVLGNDNDGYYFITGKGTFSEGQTAITNNIPLYAYDEQGQFRSIMKLEVLPTPEVKIAYGKCIVGKPIELKSVV
jgi:hypothetical protein